MKVPAGTRAKPASSGAKPRAMQQSSLSKWVVGGAPQESSDDEFVTEFECEFDCGFDGPTKAGVSAKKSKLEGKATSASLAARGVPLQRKMQPKTAETRKRMQTMPSTVTTDEEDAVEAEHSTTVVVPMQHACEACGKQFGSAASVRAHKGLCQQWNSKSSEGRKKLLTKFKVNSKGKNPKAQSAAEPPPKKLKVQLTHWTPQADMQLKKAVAKRAFSIDWDEVADAVDGYSLALCKRRWFNVLKPSHPAVRRGLKGLGDETPDDECERAVVLIKAASPWRNGLSNVERKHFPSTNQALQFLKVSKEAFTKHVKGVKGREPQDQGLLNGWYAQFEEPPPGPLKAPEPKLLKPASKPEEVKDQPKNQHGIKRPARLARPVVLTRTTSTEKKHFPSTNQALQFLDVSKSAFVQHVQGCDPLQGWYVDYGTKDKPRLEQRPKFGPEAGRGIPPAAQFVLRSQSQSPRMKVQTEPKSTLTATKAAKAAKAATQAAKAAKAAKVATRAAKAVTSEPGQTSAYDHDQAQVRQKRSRRRSYTKPEPEPEPEQQQQQQQQQQHKEERHKEPQKQKLEQEHNQEQKQEQKQDQEQCRTVTADVFDEDKDTRVEILIQREPKPELNPKTQLEPKQMPQAEKGVSTRRVSSRQTEKLLEKTDEAYTDVYNKIAVILDDSDANDSDANDDSEVYGMDNFMLGPMDDIDGLGFGASGAPPLLTEVTEALDAAEEVTNAICAPASTEAGTVKADLMLIISGVSATDVAEIGGVLGDFVTSEHLNDDPVMLTANNCLDSVHGFAPDEDATLEASLEGFKGLCATLPFSTECAPVDVHCMATAGDAVVQTGGESWPDVNALGGMIHASEWRNESAELLMPHIGFVADVTNGGCKTGESSRNAAGDCSTQLSTENPNSPTPPAETERKPGSLTSKETTVFEMRMYSTEAAFTSPKPAGRTQQSNRLYAQAALLSPPPTPAVNSEAAFTSPKPAGRTQQSNRHYAQAALLSPPPTPAVKSSAATMHTPTASHACSEETGYDGDLSSNSGGSNPSSPQARKRPTKKYPKKAASVSTGIMSPPPTPAAREGSVHTSPSPGQPRRSPRGHKRKPVSLHFGPRPEHTVESLGKHALKFLHCDAKEGVQSYMNLPYTVSRMDTSMNKKKKAGE